MRIGGLCERLPKYRVSRAAGYPAARFSLMGSSQVVALGIGVQNVRNHTITGEA
jgi:hypothetical protein